VKLYSDKGLDDRDQSETNEFFRRKKKKALQTIQIETTNMREGKRN